MKKLIFIILILFSVSSMAEDQVKYWQSFHSEMTPQDVADELNKMGILKNKATVKKIPRKPKYIYRGYNWIPVISKNRISVRNRGGGMKINGYIFEGPFFYFDKKDKLAEVWFTLSFVPNRSVILPFCVIPPAADGEKAFTYLSGALQNKYKLISENINFGLESESVRIFSDDETRVWLVMEKKYQSCYGKETKHQLARVTLRYSDWQRIETIRRAEKVQATKDAVEDAINIL